MSEYQLAHDRANFLAASKVQKLLESGGQQRVMGNAATAAPLGLPSPSSTPSPASKSSMGSAEKVESEGLKAGSRQSTADGELQGLGVHG